MAESWVNKSGLEYFKDKMSSEVDDKLKELAAVSIVLSGTGFRVLSDGRIEQWGKALVANGSGTRVVFPVAFKEAIEGVKCDAIGGVPVSYSVEPEDGSLGAVTIKHNGDGGVETFYRAIGR